MCRAVTGSGLAGPSPPTANVLLAPTPRGLHAPSTRSRSVHADFSWARLLKRVFDIDIKRCPNCGGALFVNRSHGEECGPGVGLISPLFRCDIGRSRS